MKRVRPYANLAGWGLSLAIGMLIDDAIVVRENIVRHLQRGKDHVKASLDGTNEIGLAVMATTFTIVAVFIPDAPNPHTGAVMFMSPDRITPADISTPATMKCLRRLGAGSKELSAALR